MQTEQREMATWQHDEANRIFAWPFVSQTPDRVVDSGPLRSVQPILDTVTTLEVSTIMTDALRHNNILHNNLVWKEKADIVVLQRLRHVSVGVATPDNEPG